MLERKTAAVIKKLRILRYQREFRRSQKSPQKDPERLADDAGVLSGILQKAVTGVIVSGILFLAATGTVALIYPVTRSILLKFIFL